MGCTPQRPEASGPALCDGANGTRTAQGVPCVPGRLCLAGGLRLRLPLLPLPGLLGLPLGLGLL